VVVALVVPVVVSVVQAVLAAVDEALGGGSGQRIDPVGGVALQSVFKWTGAFVMNGETWGTR
jgi:hypothetical protein